MRKHHRMEIYAIIKDIYIFNTTPKLKANREKITEQ
jgi:hypothetical protein